MKKTFFLLLIMGFYFAASSQTFEEWFRQKATQKKYLLEQIVALQVQNGFIRSGYRIAQTGTDSISKSKSGDVRLHSDHFLSFQRVSARVRNYGKVATIITYTTKTLAKAKQAINDAPLSKQLTAEEISHCTKVFQALVGECTKAIDELLAVTTDGEREMSEDERIRRINELYKDVQEQYGFCCSFGESVALLTQQRLIEQEDISRSKTINGLQ